MTVKERFGKYTTLKKEIKQIEQEIQDMEYRLRRMDISLMLSSPISGSDIKRAEEALIALGGKYVDMLESLYREKLELEKIIAMLDDCVERLVLRYRYIDDLKWYTICAKTGYERTQLHRISSRALEKLEAKYGSA